MSTPVQKPPVRAAEPLAFGGAVMLQALRARLTDGSFYHRAPAGWREHVRAALAGNEAELQDFVQAVRR